MKYNLNCEFNSLEELKIFLGFYQENKIGIEEKYSENKDLSKFSIQFKTKKPWTQFELDYVRDHYIAMKSNDIGRALGRSKGSIVQVLNVMYKKGLPKKSHKAKNI